MGGNKEIDMYIVSWFTEHWEGETYFRIACIKTERTEGPSWSQHNLNPRGYKFFNDGNEAQSFALEKRKEGAS